jgi:hypothetical protein
MPRSFVQIPYSSEQGIFLADQGMKSAEQAICFEQREQQAKLDASCAKAIHRCHLGVDSGRLRSDVLRVRSRQELEV